MGSAGRQGLLAGRLLHPALRHDRSSGPGAAKRGAERGGHRRPHRRGWAACRANQFRTGRVRCRRRNSSPVLVAFQLSWCTVSIGTLTSCSNVRLLRRLRCQTDVFIVARSASSCSRRSEQLVIVQCWIGTLTSCSNVRLLRRLRCQTDVFIVARSASSCSRRSEQLVIVQCWIGTLTSC